VVDSIQTLYSEQLTSAPGSVSQVRECVAQLARYAKSSGAVVVLVGHGHQGRRDRRPARGRAHRWISVLYFEGDTHRGFRLRARLQERFGAG